MKTELEIRERLEALLLLRGKPCDCSAQGHGEECRIGGLIMKSHVGLLRWVLGQAPDEDLFNAELLLQASEFRSVVGLPTHAQRIAESVSMLRAWAPTRGDEDLVALEKRVRENGPARVLVGRDGRAVGWRRAKARGYSYDHVLVRDDGWTLGFPDHLGDEALALWPGRWVHLFDCKPT